MSVVCVPVRDRIDTYAVTVIDDWWLVGSA